MNTAAWKSWAGGAAVVAALLGTTACGPDAAEDSATAAPSDRAGTTGPAKPGGAASATPDGADSPKPGATSGTPAGSDGPTAVAACTTEHLAVSARKEPADATTARHLLITVQNAGDKACALYGYPRVRLGADAQATVPVIKDSDPDPGKPVTLAPGDEAHAALLVSGGARDEYEAKSIRLTLQGRTPGSTAGRAVDVPMPVRTLYADDGQLVTYWTTASGAALDFIMSK
ncbi:DUF4232 domain-containing protein [Streptomyces sp. NPDC006339]|uniref:DUF4232 domain-containing protein n=1 Tax=Streptomyces sp. NPDC006339 TaxID=3156755 RepID=UPI0033B79857